MRGFWGVLPPLEEARALSGLGEARYRASYIKPCLPAPYLIRTAREGARTPILRSPVLGGARFPCRSRLSASSGRRGWARGAAGRHGRPPQIVAPLSRGARPFQPRDKTMKKLIAAMAVAITCSFVVPAWADSAEEDALIGSIIELRQSVDLLHMEILSGTSAGKTCSNSCSGRKADGTVWISSCSVPGCTKCIAPSCGENHCVAGCEQ